MNNEEEVIKILFELFKQDDMVNEWLRTPKWFFDNLSPLEILNDPNGFEAIISILNKVQYGDFS